MTRKVVSLSGIRRAPAWPAVAALSLFFSCGAALGQALRFSNHRRVQPPERASLRLGPFYSSIEFTQSAGFRYCTTRGTGTDFLFGNERGVIREDGPEWPLVSSLDFRSYVILTPRTDIDMSLRALYAVYPLNTQEDEFRLMLPEAGIFGNFSSELVLGPFLRARAYENASYRTDYIDTRGRQDIYGGSAYEHLENQLGMNLDWKLARNKNVGLDFRREDVVPRDDAFRRQERTTYAEGAVYEHELSEGLVVGAGASFAQTQYKAEDRRDTRSEDYSLFVRCARGALVAVTEATSISAGIGLASGRERSKESAAGSDVSDEGDVHAVSGHVRLETLLRKDLSHSLVYERALRSGFDAPFETTDTWEYRLKWKGEFANAEAYSALSEVEPAAVSVPRYSDWTSGIGLTRVVSRSTKLLASSSYSARDNGVTEGTGEAEWLNDYNTWATRAEVLVSLSRKLSLSVSADHVVRTGDSTDLEYTRDIFAAIFSYRHEF